MKSEDTTRAFCLNCFRVIKGSPIRKRIEGQSLLCQDCLEEMVKEPRIQRRFKTDILFLSTYDGIRKDRLLRYKEYGDIALRKVFLFYFLPWVRIYSASYIFVPLPSSEKRNLSRGFVHLEERLASDSIPFLSCLGKTDGKEQKEKNAVQRRESKDIVFTGRKEDIQGKKILLFDDVFTTGSTFYQSLMIRKELGAKKVKGLILMDNYLSKVNLIH